MGLWWKKVDVKPPEEGCVVFEGDPKALSKKRWPVLWRFGQNWALLKVAFDVPYILFFESNGVVMQYKTALRTNVVFVRIGPEQVKFWGISPGNLPVEVSFDGRWIQAPLRQDKLPGRLPRSAPAFYRQHYPFI
jgi:hypothetical protein